MKKWHLFSSVFQIVVGVAAIAAYVVLAVSGEFPARWTITFLLGVSFVVIGTIGIIDYTKKNKYL